MKWLLAERQSGKTTELIRRCSDDEYSLIVCPNQSMCKNTYAYAKELGLDIPMPITFDDFVNGKFDRRHVERFYFDELQMSLTAYAREVPIDTVVIGIANYKIDILKKGIAVINNAANFFRKPLGKEMEKK